MSSKVTFYWPSMLAADFGELSRAASRHTTQGSGDLLNSTAQRRQRCPLATPNVDFSHRGSSGSAACAGKGMFGGLELSSSLDRAHETHPSLAAAALAD